MVMGDCSFLQTASSKYFILPSSGKKITRTFLLGVHLQDSFLVQRSQYIKSNPHGQHDHPFRRCPLLQVLDPLAAVAPSNGFPLEDVPVTKSATPISINKKTNAMSSEVKTDQCQTNSVKRPRKTKHWTYPCLISISHLGEFG